MSAVRETPPVEIIHVSLRAGAHEASGYNWPTVKSTPVIELLAMDKPTGSFAFRASAGFLYDEPFRKPPDADSFGGLTGIVLGGRWRIEPWRGNPRHNLELACEPQLKNFLQIVGLRPGFEAADDGRMFR
jgi:hypothetical protein